MIQQTYQMANVGKRHIYEHCCQITLNAKVILGSVVVPGPSTHPFRAQS